MSTATPRPRGAGLRAGSSPQRPRDLQRLEPEAGQGSPMCSTDTWAVPVSSARAAGLSQRLAGLTELAEGLLLGCQQK